MDHVGYMSSVSPVVFGKPDVNGFKVVHHDYVVEREKWLSRHL
jgi:hypothetical protein